jgi:hypothetical protein
MSLHLIDIILPCFAWPCLVDESVTNARWTAQQDVPDDPDKTQGLKLQSDEGKDEEVVGASAVIQSMQRQETVSLGAKADAPSHKEATSSVAAAISPPAPSRPLSSLPFPAQLMNLLQRNVAPGALWFLDGGEAIGIDAKAIVGTVLNEHFRGMKFNSLVRNLNRW